ncbi:hypothetical protein P175DRAFT_0529792 [Aspergillus ochraceoroseus IBT 24754]|uniref:Mid2 domain-containing protein n=1 Tax=Aspergillus ochraceoroseus IBT 24754 TaxID=1392256 RepID=A0A2T5M2F3_9EURO|nr:uncharacterized protein P175DRAFT_0529792 [Aspergillus ochraceoroseus IBT 24754]PTU22715.1 hypothetical protein P175DRAFT_0529792 [Aspergillus ochraceoroseus IBT 24754]
MNQLGVLLSAEFTFTVVQAATLPRSTQRDQIPDATTQSSQRKTNKEETENNCLPSLAKTGLAIGIILGVLLIACLFFTIIMRMKYFTLQSLFSRRSRKGRKLTKPWPTPTAETGPAYEHPAPTSTVTTYGSRPRGTATAMTPRNVIQPVDKELVDPRNVSPPIGHHQQASLAYSACTSTCTLDQTTSRRPLVLVPVVQQQQQDTASTQGYESIKPHSPLLPPPLSLPPLRPSRPLTPTRLEPPASPSPSRLTTTTRSSATFPWGFEPYASEDVPVADTLSEDQVLILPSPPNIPQFYARGF